MANGSPLPHRKNMEPSRGFTLIEIIAVVAIMAIIAGMTIPILFNTLKREEQSATIEKIENIEIALLNFYRDINQFPLTAAGLKALIKNPFSSKPLGLWWYGPYISYSNIDNYDLDSWGESLVYTNNGGVPVTATLTSKGPNRKLGDKDDIIRTISAAQVISVIQEAIDEITMANAAGSAYKSDNGSWPKNIGELTPKYLEYKYQHDPWAKDYINAVKESFYSSGPNKKDDSSGGFFPGGDDIFLKVKKLK